MSDSEIVRRLAAAILVGTVVGIERQWHHKNAGVKTHTLVAIGAATFALLSELGLGSNLQAVPIAAGVVTGIGFIGGGLIMRRAGNVQGINSAATLWATGGLGLAVGGGHYTVAAAGLVAVLIAQAPLHGISTLIDRVSGGGPAAALEAYRLIVAFSPAGEPAVWTALDEFARATSTKLVDRAETRAGAADVVVEVRFVLRHTQLDALRALAGRVSSAPGVARVEWTRCADENE